MFKVQSSKFKVQRRFSPAFLLSPFCVLRSAFCVLLSALCFLLSPSCHRQPPQLPANKAAEQDTARFEMLELNRKLIEYEDSTLAVYIKNTQQPFVRDSLGYWYKINSETMQKNVAHGSVFNIEYVVYSLDNKLLAKQTANITLGKKQTAAAIEDVLQKLPAGCAATLIAPYYLAYGARGDGANIKPYQAVRIEVKIMEE